ncbi:MAG TPA: cytochrome c3 family protein [Polyangia bacterium]|nr:cytochrome c3 family protein [Polyangia bacterium]
MIGSGKRARMVVLVAVAAVAGTLAARASGGESSPRPSPIVYPPATIPIAFDHAQHARLGVSCQSCHAAASTSTGASDDLLPLEAACRDCHKIDRRQPDKAVAKGEPAARCIACHVGWSGTEPLSEPPRPVLPPPNVKFNHKLHVSRGMGCELCHANVAVVPQTPAADLPMMAVCLGCHNGKQASARCAACHPTLPDGRLKVEFPVNAGHAGAPAPGLRKLVPSGSLRGFDAHTMNFRTNHKQAGRDEGYCLTCHRRSECVDCHGGVVRPFDIHPSDYVTLHAMDARRNTPDCSSCHRNQSFCLGCHQRSGVGSDPEGGLPGHQPHNPFGTGTQVKRFHPPNWVRDQSGAVIATPTPASHSFAAKRNINACVSCHREETCLECHSTDPVRGAHFDPHGPGFAGSLKCRSLAARNQRACLKCHTAGDPQLTCR